VFDDDDDPVDCELVVDPQLANTKSNNEDLSMIDCFMFFPTFLG
jgi:hypothetical protein